MSFGIYAQLYYRARYQLLEHLDQVERLPGSLRSINGQRRMLSSGETVNVPAGTPHLWWNGGDDALHVRAEFRPALNTERFFETFFGLGRDGQTDAKGMPRFLQLAVLVPEYDLYLAQPPLVLQKLLFGVLAPIGRLCGYKAWYPQYSTGR